MLTVRAAPTTHTHPRTYTSVTAWYRLLCTKKKRPATVCFAWVAQARIAGAVASTYGYDIESNKVRSMVMCALLGDPERVRSILLSGGVEQAKVLTTHPVTGDTVQPILKRNEEEEEEEEEEGGKEGKAEKEDEGIIIENGLFSIDTDINDNDNGNDAKHSGNVVDDSAMNSARDGVGTVGGQSINVNADTKDNKSRTSETENEKKKKKKREEVGSILTHVAAVEDAPPELNLILQATLSSTTTTATLQGVELLVVENLLLAAGTQMSAEAASKLALG